MEVCRNTGCVSVFHLCPRKYDCILHSCDRPDSTARMDLKPAKWTGGGGKDMMIKGRACLATSMEVFFHDILLFLVIITGRVGAKSICTSMERFIKAPLIISSVYTTKSYLQI